MMLTVVLIQLPIPQVSLASRTGNVPLGAACLKMAASGIKGVRVEIVPESVSSYLGDAALLDRILLERPDIVGFSVFSWNLERSQQLAREIKDLLPVRVIFGGPEITPDNRTIESPHVDFYVYGEGEAVFKKLLADSTAWEKRSGSINADLIFRSAPSPYLSGLLEPEIEDTLFLETQRGCPYQCGYCYYNKSIHRHSFVREALLAQAIQWGHDRGLAELYLLDPSLNTRPRLKALLKTLCRINCDHRMDVISEIRAEAIDEPLAALFAEAGFTLFEVGLQSTNPRALEVMNRPTDLERFLQGVKHLQHRGIQPKIDLIAGLPGDDLKGFKQSVDFVVENDLHHTIQVFPLSVLPGTEFRARHRELGLQFEPHPPYVVTDTPTFCQDDIAAAFSYAEDAFDIDLHPLPRLDLAYRDGGASGAAGTTHPDLGTGLYVSRVLIEQERPLSELSSLARRLTHPYKVIVGTAVHRPSYLTMVVKTLTAANPFTPLEIIFHEPVALPDTEALRAAAEIHRPHYLDLELRYLTELPGDRVIVFTLVTSHLKNTFSGPMKRQVYWWRDPALPTIEELEALSYLDGVLIDVEISEHAVAAWQDRLAPQADRVVNVSFSERGVQRRWLRLISPDDYFFGAPYVW